MALTRAVSDYKDSVKAATTGNITLNGGAPTVVDDVNLEINDSVLVINQDDPTENGIFKVASLGTGTNGTWVRRNDFLDYRYVSSGSLTFVEEGSANGNVYYYIGGTAGNVQIGTSPIHFSNLFSHIGEVLNLTGLLGDVYAAIETKTSYANANVDAYLPTYTGNIQADNLQVGNIQAGNLAIDNIQAGNIQAGNLFTDNAVYVTDGVFWAGNNAPYLDVANLYSNANVGAYLPTYTGDIQAGNLLTNNSVYITDGIFWAGNNQPYLVYSNSNVAAYLPTYTGNVKAGNLLTTDSMYTTNGVFWASNNAPFSSLQIGGYNTSIQFNDLDKLNGTNYLQYNKNTGQLTSNSTSNSSSITTGAVVLQGGMGIGGNLFVGGNLHVAGVATIVFDETIYRSEYANVVYANAVYATTIGNVGTTLIGNAANISGNINSGNINVDGNVAISSNLFVGGNILVTDNVTVSSNINVSGNINVDGNLIGSNSYITGNIFAGNVYSNFFWPNGVSILDFSTSDITLGNLDILPGGLITFGDNTTQGTRAPKLWTNWSQEFTDLGFDALRPGDFYFDDGTGGLEPDYASGLLSIYLVTEIDDGSGTGTLMISLLDMTIRALA